MGATLLWAMMLCLLAGLALWTWAPGARRALAWIYLAGLVAQMTVGVVSFAWLGAFDTPLGLVRNGVLLLADLLTLAGFVACLRSRPLPMPVLWRALVVVLSLRLAAGVLLSAANLAAFPWDGSTEHLVAVSGLLSAAVLVPLLVTLGWCAFASPMPRPGARHRPA